MIDINSIFLHDSWAYNSQKSVYIIDISKYKLDDLKDYKFFMIISGKYKDGKNFKRMECEVSRENFNYFLKNHY